MHTAAARSCPHTLNVRARVQVTTRTRVLDYFLAQKDIVKDDHMLFRFESSMAAGNIKKLMEQICWEIGFPDS